VLQLSNHICFMPAFIMHILTPL